MYGLRSKDGESNSLTQKDTLAQDNRNFRSQDSKTPTETARGRLKKADPTMTKLVILLIHLSQTERNSMFCPFGHINAGNVTHLDE